MRGNRYVIKEIRANLMLDWFTSCTDARIVFRHPSSLCRHRVSDEYKDPAGELDWIVDVDEILCQPLPS